MYTDHFGFSEPPFRITPHTDFFFSGANRGATLEALLYAIIHNEGIVKVTGEVGSGKTMLCRVLMERLPAHVETIYLASPSLSRDEILIAIADELQLDLGSERSTRVVRALQEALIRLYAGGRRVVVLIDEAHAMPRETLEEIRLLSNLEGNRNKLLQVVLFGQPELDALLNTSEMRQLKERITHNFHLEPLVSGDIASYIEFRLRAAGYRGPNPFTPRALRIISRASEGLTRRINILADKSLLAAFAANSHTVDDKEAARAVADSEFYRPPARIPRVPAAYAAAGLAAGILVGWSLFQVLERLDESSSSAAAMTSRPAVASALPAARSDKEAAVQPTRTRETVPSAPTARREAAVTAPLVRTSAPSDSGASGKAASLPLEGSGLLPPAAGKLVQQRFQATQEWLEQAPKGHYAIQLLTVKDSDVGRLERFLRKASEEVNETDLYVYSVKIDGVQHYRAAYGSYAGANAVQAAIVDLPPVLKAQNPYPRSVERMRSQNRQ